MTATGLAIIYAAFAALAVVAFAFLKPRDAVFVTYFAGWLVLPVGVYPAAVNPGWLPIEIVGLTLPSQMLWTKAVVAPLVAIVYSLVLDWRRWRTMRPVVLDFVVIAFCLWPLLQGRYLDNEYPLSDDAAMYLAAVWGSSWWLGRLYCTLPTDRDAFLWALTIAGLFMVPAALIEGIYGPTFHHSLFGRAPYEFDGSLRYVGHRPLLLFEHGNQYAIWVALAAVAAVIRSIGHRQSWWFAVILVATSSASQSVGAIILLIIGMSLITVRLVPPRWFWQMSIVALGLVALGLMTGLIPLGRVASIGGIGEYVADMMRLAGRGSMPWRVTQQLRVLPIIREQFLLGYGTWFWWSPSGTRPWGFPLMMIGQYGLIGFMLIFVPMTFGAARVVWSHALLPLTGAAAFGLLLLLAGVDAMLNNFIFFPAVLIGGGLASARQQDAQELGAKSGFERLGNRLDGRARSSMRRAR